MKTIKRSKIENKPKLVPYDMPSIAKMLYRIMNAVEDIREYVKYRKEIFSKLQGSSSLIKLIGIIPPISLEEEKEIIRKTIQEKMIK